MRTRRQVNAWSLQYTHHAFSPVAEQSTALPDPPAGHARAVFWLASAALQSGNPTLAETLVASQAARGDPLSMRLMGDALLAQGDFAGALAIWQKAGDVASLLRAASQVYGVGLPVVNSPCQVEPIKTLTNQYTLS